ncbi:MAG TPA: thioredoxin domain-containing protein [Pseudonocardiaceae bacterium]|jgi:protein-disulfide isomerase|nr:thioredoxin domain-containing protein [Pseudonocardiaceae bacterium]
MIVGGAQRNNRKQKQKQSAAAAARAVAAARGTKKDLTKIIGAIVIVVVIAGVVIGGVLYTKHRSDEAAQTVIPAKTVSGANAYSATIDKANATVLVGKPAAKVTIDAYEDFMCPVCGEFESTYFNDIAKQLQAGTIKVRYHMLNLLDNSSVPAGYSLMSANTALAVATVAPDKFIDYHYSLYQKQPQENGPGWTQAQLSNLASRLGVSGAEFDQLVNDKTYEKQIQTNLDNAEKDQALFQTDQSGQKGFGTPTIVADGKTINWQSDTTWLSDLVKAAYPTS